jgi:hypothetical protein
MIARGHAKQQVKIILALHLANFSAIAKQMKLISFYLQGQLLSIKILRRNAF